MKKRKMERRRTGRRSEDEGGEEDGRRSSRPRTSAAAADRLPTPSRDLPPPRMGTSAELNGIMKGANARSERMRTSILIGAILAARVGGVGASLDGDRPFLGANGRTYPDLRLAFGKHSRTRQCSLCKMRVQGSWYCRVGHGHLDRPDHDGGNSASVLAELSRMSTDELEGRLRGLMMTTTSSSSSCPRIAAAGGGGRFHGTGWSMDDLGNDLLYHVASFLPSLSDLSSLCMTSRRARRLLLGRRSEDLLRGVFLRAFGVGAPWGWETLERVDLSWRDLWVTIRGLRRGLKRGSIAPPPPPDDGLLLRDTIGILPEHDEGDAIYYDNPSHADPDAEYCNGYFGMGALRLPPPPNAGPDWQPPIILRGDFDGIRILESSSSLSRRREETPIGGGPGLHGDMRVVGAEEGGGQVLSLIRCDPSSSTRAGVHPPCCFIGYASGRVAAVSATLGPGGDVYAFAISGSHHAHDSEVTALAFVDCGSSPRDGSAPVLFSACCAGKVYFYPHAFDPDENFSMERSVLAFSNYYDCPIFSMASTSMESHGHFYSVICTGDRDGNIRLWLKPDDDLVGLCARAESQKFRHIQLCKSSTVSGTGFHLVTRAFFVRNNLLITGTNNGDVRFWQMQVAENASRAIGRGPLPALTLRYDLMGIHNGAVELLTVVGDVLLSSGGNDGKIVGWDIATGLRLGTIRCHPGRRLEDGGGTIRSCVVDLLLFGQEGSLISLCRDGSLKLFKM
ncbi:hypothetical protein ACHAW5_009496 [Stephanodiscus triporus]|uniref:F-box/WD repeat-containing protein 7 n=1 Tax=Stephanodiscus triporus TaxID=2934178 RepID=A0ABD3PYH4_9STRA